MIDFSGFVDLPLIWAALIAIAILMYVILDGFDLGIGILFPFAPSNTCQDKMMNSVAPFWDGNETWLVLGGAGLLVAFPLAYSVLLPALYLPIIFMLIGLIFRGVAFEFRFKSPEKHIKMWNVSFHAGSLLATFMQGVILGNITEGITVHERSFAGGPWDWAGPFPILNGIALIFGYALLGATWLVMKTDSITQKWARQATIYSLSLVILFVGIIGVYLPFVDKYHPRLIWLHNPIKIVVIVAGIIAAIAAFSIFKDIRGKKREIRPFIVSCSLFVLGYIVLAVSLWPWIVPYNFTIWDAAAASTSLSLSLIGIIFFLPLILMYTAYCYYVFRGKTSEKSMY